MSTGQTVHCPESAFTVQCRAVPGVACIDIARIEIALWQPTSGFYVGID